MSVDELRETAALIRSRAKAATPGPWGQVISDRFGPQCAIHTPVSNLNIHEHANPGEYRGAQNAEHIASWHPTVALAVADLLDHLADGWDLANEHRASVGQPPRDYPESRALIVARTYLGRTP